MSSRLSLRFCYELPVVLGRSNPQALQQDRLNPRTLGSALVHVTGVFSLQHPYSSQFSLKARANPAWAEIAGNKRLCLEFSAEGWKRVGSLPHLHRGLSASLLQ